ncbi:MAG: flagellar hook-basal body complex protein FliE [Candidatus Thermoplasmatota archaeon]|nr:flagellar hook-basal body complex protein FliE [Candidatus Thermoplasmatota archaeon]
MKIIAFTGMPGSGKSEAVQLAKDRGIPVVRMGDLVWEETKRQGKPLDDQHVGEVASQMRTEQGMDMWARRTMEQIRTLKPSSLLVIDGVRNPEEIDYFKKKLGKDFLVVAIDACEELRQQRVAARGRIDDAASTKKFKERDQREIQWGLQKVIAEADIIISNNTSLQEFQHQVLQLFDQL